MYSIFEIKILGKLEIVARNMLYTENNCFHCKIRVNWPNTTHSTIEYKLLFLHKLPNAFTIFGG